jgi:hypothetical protein
VREGEPLVSSGGEAQHDSITRREVLGGLSLAIGTLALGVPAFSRAAPTGSSGLAAVLNRISDAIIPGSSAQRVGEFAAETLAYEFRGLTLDHVMTVVEALQGRSKGHFCSDTGAQCSTVVASLDEDVYAGKSGAGIADAWKTLKLALLSVYYTTQKGASQDLSYVPVPGHWRPDVSIAEQPTAFWSDTWARWYT